jgi:hypothetical protein
MPSITCFIYGNLYLDEVIRTWLTKLKTSKYFKQLILTHYYLQMTSSLFLTQKTICNKRFIYYTEYPKNIIWKLPQKRQRYLVLLGQTDQIKKKIIINDETLEQVSQFTYLGCSISYQFSNDVEFKLAKFLQIIGIIKRTIFRKVRTETILKIYNNLVLPTFLYGSEKLDSDSLTETKN